MQKNISSPLPLQSVRVTDPFWSREISLIRDAVIPYQWDALNDRIPDAEKSWWAHNMRAAARAVNAKKAGGAYTPVQKSCGFTVYPPAGEAPRGDSFFGFPNQHVNAKGHALIAKRLAQNAERVLNENLPPEIEEENVKGV